MRGFLYSLTGFGHAEMFVVSCFNLRKLWDGPICVLINEAEESSIVEELERDTTLDVSIKRIPLVRSRRNTRHMATKTTMYIHTPFDENIYIDCDTLPVGDMTDLFGPPLALTQFVNWLSTQKRIRTRIGRWHGISPMIEDLIDTSTMGQAAVNTGVLGFHKKNPELYKWYDLAMQNPNSFLVDEIAMQILFPSLENVEIFPHKYNCSVTYGADEEDVRCWHFHGNRRHLKKEEGRKLWIPAFEEAVKENVANISSWAGQGDPSLPDFLEIEKTQ